jgi:hypothetical protein
MLPDSYGLFDVPDLKEEEHQSPQALPEPLGEAEMMDLPRLFLPE